MSGVEHTEPTAANDDDEQDKTSRYVARPQRPEIIVECFMICEAVRITEGQFFIFGGGLDVYDVHDGFPAKIPFRLAVRLRLPIRFQSRPLPCSLIFAKRLEEDLFAGIPLIDELTEIDFIWDHDTPPFRRPPSESMTTFVAASVFSYEITNISEAGPYVIVFKVHDENVAMIPLVVVDRSAEHKAGFDVP